MSRYIDGGAEPRLTSGGIAVASIATNLSTILDAVIIAIGEISRVLNPLPVLDVPVNRFPQTSGPRFARLPAKIGRDQADP
jgi:hypothetical protein